jgi:hypothetical protein
MWFAKWFGVRNVVQEDDEPARHAAPTASQPATAAPQARRPGDAKASPKKGFDPYNSGAFERRSAWERVGRR